MAVKPLRRVYMDNHASTRVDPRVVEAMLPYFDEAFGNPGSQTHRWGVEARSAVEQSRETIARLIGANADEILFTSGATESNNLAIRGAAERPRLRGNELVTSATEHPSVLAPAERLERLGWKVTRLAVAQSPEAASGVVDLDALESAIGDATVVTSVMLANNEIGVIQPLETIAAICRPRGVLLHCDATQAVGKIPIDVKRLGVDLMSFTAHKIYGPKGVGALYRRTGRPGVRIVPQILGGGQEEGLRSGTLNVPGIVGFARALQLCNDELEVEMRRLTELRSRLWAGLAAALPQAVVCGPALDAVDPWGRPLRLPGNLSVSLGSVDGEAVLLEVPTLGLSSGAACASGEPGPSHVLLALGLDPDRARSTLRFGLGRFNTAEDVDQALELIPSAVERLGQLGG